MTDGEERRGYRGRRDTREKHKEKEKEKKKPRGGFREKTEKQTRKREIQPQRKRAIKEERTGAQRTVPCGLYCWNCAVVYRAKRVNPLSR